VPKVDGGVLVVTRREPALLPPAMAGAFAEFVGLHWPFPPTNARPGSTFPGDGRSRAPLVDPRRG